MTERDYVFESFFLFLFFFKEMLHIVLFMRQEKKVKTVKYSEETLPRSHFVKYTKKDCQTIKHTVEKRAEHERAMDLWIKDGLSGITTTCWLRHD